MLAAINKAVTLVVNYGPGQTGKTIGYTLKNGDGTTFQARTTTGVSELQAGSGSYKVELANTVFTAAFDGYVIWDVANAAPYVSEDIFISDRIDAAISSRADGAQYTTARAAKLDNLDVAVSTRSTYAGGDTSGTTTLLARLTATRAGNLDFLDAAISALPSPAAIASAVWAAGTRTLTAISDSAGVTTLLSRLTSGRAANLDNLDAPISGIAAGATPSQVADAVWDEQLSGHATAGSAGAALTAVDDATAQLGPATVILRSPLAAGATLNLIRGDDYFAADGRQLEWSSTTWPNLTGATVSLVIDPGATPTATVSCSLVAVGGGTQTVRAEPASPDTNKLRVGQFTYAVVATLASGHKATLVESNGAAT